MNAAETARINMQTRCDPFLALLCGYNNEAQALTLRKAKAEWLAEVLKGKIRHRRAACSNVFTPKSEKEGSLHIKISFLLQTESITACS